MVNYHDRSEVEALRWLTKAHGWVFTTMPSLIAVQTGLRRSELSGQYPRDVALSAGTC